MCVSVCVCVCVSVNAKCVNLIRLCVFHIIDIFLPFFFKVINKHYKQIQTHTHTDQNADASLQLKHMVFCTSIT